MRAEARWAEDVLYLEFQGTYSPNNNCTYNPILTLLGHLKGLISGFQATGTVITGQQVT